MIESGGVNVPGRMKNAYCSKGRQVGVLKECCPSFESFTAIVGVWRHDKDGGSEEQTIYKLFSKP